MNKYIDAEKLKAEIDSILSGCTKQTHTGVYNTCHRIKSIIASLQQEQPEVNIWHDVKKEAPTDFGAEIIVLCKNKNKEDGIWLADLIQCFEGQYKPRENWEDPVKWAYLSEILPQRD